MEKLTDLWSQFYYWAAAQPVFVQVAMGLATFLLAILLLWLALILAGLSLYVVHHILAAIVEDARELPGGLLRMLPASRWRRLVFFVVIPALVVLAFLLFVA